MRILDNDYIYYSFGPINYCFSIYYLNTDKYYINTNYNF